MRHRLDTTHSPSSSPEVVRAAGRRGAGAPPGRACKLRLCALQAVAGRGPRRPRRACEERKMRTWSLLALALSGLLVAGEPSSARAADKDTLVIALDTLGAQVMDPIMDTRAPHAHYQAPIWDSLVGFDLENGGIGPGVAERWQLAADGQSWTFYLRKGQRFHNGDPLTAQDVKFSLERVMSPESISSGAAALRRAVDRIEAVDDLTVRVYTKGVIPQFVASLSRAVFMEGSVMPKKYIEAVGTKGFREKPIGSGPWKFVRLVPGDRIEYEAVTTPHWRGTPQFKKMTLLLVPEQSTRIAMVRTGEASIVSIGPEAIKEAQAGGMRGRQRARHHAGGLSVLGPLPSR